MKIAFWLFQLVMALLIPAVMICFGKKFRDAPPKNINMTFGYRTTRSMKNKDTWDFAHRCIGTLWLRFGAVLLIASVILMLFSLRMAVEDIARYCVILVFAQLIPMLIPIFIVEHKLKQTFDKDGKRK